MSSWTFQGPPMATGLQYPSQTFAATLTSASVALLLDPGRIPLQRSNLAAILYHAFIILVLFLGIFNLSLSFLQNAEEKLSNFAKIWLHSAGCASLAVVFAMRLSLSVASASALYASALVFLAALTIVLGVPFAMHLRSSNIEYGCFGGSPAAAKEKAGPPPPPVVKGRKRKTAAPPCPCHRWRRGTGYR